MASTSKNAKDYSKPLFIKHGEDHISDMNLPTSGSMTNIEVLEKQLESSSSLPDPSKTKSSPSSSNEPSEGKLSEAMKLKRKVVVG